MPKLAYSYIRFSSEAQSEGDSVRRQLEATRKYCAKNGLILNDQFQLRDLGISAYEGKNAENGALGIFIDACQTGKIPKGSALVVEAMDRISRQKPRKTIRLMGELMDDYGIEIHLTLAGKVFKPDDEEEEGINLILAVAMAMKAHSESKDKSNRIREAWAEKRSLAREAGHILTPSCPWWLKRDKKSKSGFQIIEERAEIVREIYNLAIDGWGGKRIAVHLTSRGIKPPGAKKIWRESTIRNWFVARSPEGILRATWKTRRTTEDYAIPDYYPVIINPKTAKLAHTNRRKTTGRPARSEAEGNIWRGVKTRAHDATTEPDGHWMRWQGTANGTQDPETGKRKIHNYLCALSDTDRHSILNVPTRVLERLVSIAVANAVGVEGLTAPGPAKTSLDAAISTARHEKETAAKKLENLLAVAESGKAPKSILKRITETETLLESLTAKYESAKMAANFSRVKPNKRDLTDLLLSAQSEKISRTQLMGILERLIERIDLARDIRHLQEIGRFTPGIHTLMPWGGVASRKVVALVKFRAGARWLATNKPYECALRISDE